MKKILCLIIAIVLMLTCVGCSSSSANVSRQENSGEQESMFVVVEEVMFHGYWYSVCYHKENKVMYSVSQYNEFTVMLDADGKPLLWEG